MMQWSRDADVLHLRIGENLVDLVDRAGGDALLFEQVEPLRRVSGLEDVREQGGQFRPVAETHVIGGVVGDGAELGPAERNAERTPLSVASDADVDEAVSGRKNT